ncbi:dihydrodipicolinate synthase family protein [Candidatus Sumerlaeota bacterium]|nr:dihydrodipicolinate synthase family protein [Candidatus Sumerlaeota bacterium]
MNEKARQLRERLDGALIPAVPVPFDLEGKHSESAEKLLVKYEAASPAAGVALWVHTGRGLHLGADERHRVFKRWRIGLREDQFIIAGVGCPHPSIGTLEEMGDAEYISRAADMAQDAKTFGADGILVYAPAKFRGRPNQDELIFDYHESVASVGLPMILFYLYESAGGISYSLNLLQTLLALDSVAGIKLATLDSIMTFQDVAEMIKAKFPEVALLTGEDRFLGYTIMRGAVGALIGMGAVQPGLQAALIKTWREKRYDEFVKLSIALDHFAETIFVEPMEGYIRRVMIALAADGVLPIEHTYDPWGPPVTAAERVAIAAALNELKSV